VTLLQLLPLDMRFDLHFRLPAQATLVSDTGLDTNVIDDLHFRSHLVPVLDFNLGL